MYRDDDAQLPDRMIDTVCLCLPAAPTRRVSLLSTGHSGDFSQLGAIGYILPLATQEGDLP